MNNSQVESMTDAAAELKKGTILVVDDEEIYLQLLSAMLGDDYHVYIADNGRAAIETALACKPDLILLDMVLPDMDGIHICTELKNIPELAETPVIFVTSMVDARSEVSGLQTGAVDYVSKPIKKDVLKARIEVQLALKHNRDRLLRMASTDGLTGLSNRVSFDDKLDKEIMRLSRVHLPLSLITMDVDYFKQFNDTYGHVAGDDCLRLVSAAVSANMNRLSDLAARIGGEEFACILPQVALSGAVAVAERIRQEIHRLRIPHEKSQVAPFVTLSFGVLSLTCNFNCQRQAILEQADEQLYKSKREGRDRISSALFIG
ncbi:response regulator receiver modulated diguanylate cyclase [Noviherbaspirillum humi]|uniref:diguanylate cyclase n=1 Tax=Noviherbaspirillum humi TaxID=1688639 RepID=A0A239IRX3_9BURK|nr:diguanylate cyclase [Noviherbaspirillum humi]SNS95164.1 response regulator receiver modulated diguanylate cyclase [Noviherbaspirillum humi]